MLTTFKTVGALRRRADRGDGGATLILALIFLIVVSLIVVGLVQWTGNDLTNTSKFVSAQYLQSAANSSNQLATQFVRYNFLLPSWDVATPTPCWTSPGDPSSTSLNGETVDSWCMTRWYPGLATSQRIVTISTCSSSESASNCALAPLLQTILTITDGGSACAPVLNASTSPNTCGQTLTISDWQFGAMAPVVTAVASGTFTCAAGSPVTITGTNLALATGVDFLTQGSAGSASPVSAAGSLASGASSFNFPATSSTTIQACTPAGIASNSLYAIVSTPMGSSQYGSSSLLPAG